MKEDNGTTPSAVRGDAATGDPSAEFAAKEIRRRYGLSSLHLFTSDIPNLEWRVFASRLDPKGFEASCESGGGNTIAEALASLDARLAAGPINKPYVPILDAPRSPTPGSPVVNPPSDEEAVVP